VNLALPFTYHRYVGCLTEIRSTIRYWQKAILFLLSESVLSRRPRGSLFLIRHGQLLASAEGAEKFTVPDLTGDFNERVRSLRSRGLAPR
jgi:hypothetical protein